MTKIKLNGTYKLWPEGSAPEYVIFKNGQLVGATSECNLATHDSANDSYAGIDSNLWRECSPDEARAVLAEFADEYPYPEMVVVERAI